MTSIARLMPFKCFIGLCLVLWIATGPLEAQTNRRPPKVTKDQLLKQFDLSDPKMDLAALKAPGLKKDAIPALTDPKKVSVADAKWMDPADRVASITLKGESVAYPLSILMFHEIANDRLGDVPIAVTYCPLCDSVATYDRRIPVPGKVDPHVAEFGVSGFLLNSNLVMYDRKTQGLWPQLLMKAITGPHAGRALTTLPAKIETWGVFAKAHPQGKVLSRETGHRRPYGRNPYEKYWKSKDAFYKTFTFKLDDRLPPKTLGFGVVHAGKAWFVTLRKIQTGPVKLQTADGPVVIDALQGGAQVIQAPAQAMSLQSFFHSFSAFHPDCTIVDVDVKKP